MPTRLTQEELERIIEKHELFRRGRIGGGRANLTNLDLTQLSFRGRDLSYADFSRSILYEADLGKAKLDYCQFFCADLRRANFREATLIRADLRGVCLRGASLNNADLTDADMREGSFAFYDAKKGVHFSSEDTIWKEGVGGADLRGATLQSAKLSGTIATNSNFSDANLTQASFIRGDLSGANMSGANLAGANFNNCVLRNVNMRNANLTGAMIETANLIGVDMTGALTDEPAGKTIDELPMPLDQMLLNHKVWLSSKGANGQRFDVSGFDLRRLPPLGKHDLTMMHAEGAIWYGHDMSRMNIQAALFRRSNARNCCFDATDMRGTNFIEANLACSTLRGARLEPLVLDDGRMLKADFSKANLRHVDFTGADLRNVNFSGADLSFADFSNTNTKETNFQNAVLEDTKIEEEKLNGAVVKKSGA